MVCFFVLSSAGPETSSHLCVCFGSHAVQSFSCFPLACMVSLCFFRTFPIFVRSVTQQAPQSHCSFSHFISSVPSHPLFCRLFSAFLLLHSQLHLSTLDSNQQTWLHSLSFSSSSSLVLSPICDHTDVLPFTRKSTPKHANAQTALIAVLWTAPHAKSEAHSRSFTIATSQKRQQKPKMRSSVISIRHFSSTTIWNLFSTRAQLKPSTLSRLLACSKLFPTRIWLCWISTAVAQKIWSSQMSSCPLCAFVPLSLWILVVLMRMTSRWSCQKWCFSTTSSNRHLPRVPFSM